jgi:hypothetical protein
MSKRTLILAGLAIVLIIAAFVSSFFEKKELIRNYEDPEKEPDPDPEKKPDPDPEKNSNQDLIDLEENEQADTKD